MKKLIKKYQKGDQFSYDQDGNFKFVYDITSNFNKNLLQKQNFETNNVVKIDSPLSTTTSYNPSLKPKTLKPDSIVGDIKPIKIKPIKSALEQNATGTTNKKNNWGELGNFFKSQEGVNLATIGIDAVGNEIMTNAGKQETTEGLVFKGLGKGLMQTGISTANPVLLGAGALSYGVGWLGDTTGKKVKGIQSNLTSGSYGGLGSLESKNYFFGGGSKGRNYQNDVNKMKQNLGVASSIEKQQTQIKNAGLNYSNQINIFNQNKLKGEFNSNIIMGKAGVKLNLRNIKNSVNYKLKSQNNLIEEIKEIEEPLKFEEGGKINVIPDGALHARRHNLPEEIASQVTDKGIPVVTFEEGGEIEQHAEIEVNEIIFNKDLTTKLEDMLKEYKDGNDSILIEAGKLLTYEILENTEDNTGLLETINP